VRRIILPRGGPIVRAIGWIAINLYVDVTDICLDAAQDVMGELPCPRRWRIGKHCADAAVPVPSNIIRDAGAALGFAGKVVNVAIRCPLTLDTEDNERQLVSCAICTRSLPMENGHQSRLHV
jgi:hypothetical protein